MYILAHLQKAAPVQLRHGRARLAPDAGAGGSRAALIPGANDAFISLLLSSPGPRPKHGHSRSIKGTYRLATAADSMSGIWCSHWACASPESSRR